MIIMNDFLYEEVFINIWGLIFFLQFLYQFAIIWIMIDSKYLYLHILAWLLAYNKIVMGTAI